MRTPPVTLLIDVINANTSSWRKPLSLRVTAQNPAIPYRFLAYLKKKKYIYIYIYIYIINIMRGKKDATTFPDKPVS